MKRFKYHKQNLGFDLDYIYSYYTKVAKIDWENRAIIVYDYYSQTTCKHIAYAANYFNFDVTKLYKLKQFSKYKEVLTYSENEIYYNNIFAGYFNRADKVLYIKLNKTPIKKHHIQFIIKEKKLDKLETYYR